MLWKCSKVIKENFNKKNIFIMWIISWYIFIIWFFWGLWISIALLYIGILWFYSIWWNISLQIMCIILIPTTFPWLYVTWKSLSFATNLLLEEMKRTKKEIFFINIWFIGSITIFYKFVIDFIPRIQVVPFIDSIFIGGIITFLIFKVLAYIIISQYKFNQ